MLSSRLTLKYALSYFIFSGDISTHLIFNISDKDKTTYIGPTYLTSMSLCNLLRHIKFKFVLSKTKSLVMGKDITLGFIAAEAPLTHSPGTRGALPGS